MKKMFVVNVIPVTLGQFLRIWLSPYGDRLKPLIGRFCQMCILLVVLISVSHASRTAAHAEILGHGLTATSLLLLILSVGFAHLVALFGCGFLARVMGAPGSDIVAVMFGGSHKSLPIGIYICEMLSVEGPQEALPFLSLPILIYHATQLAIDSFAIRPVERYTGR
jgi:predicted Na+-dependent transporter